MLLVSDLRLAYPITARWSNFSLVVIYREASKVFERISLPYQLSEFNACKVNTGMG
jgi:hypothetical protein